MVDNTDNSLAGAAQLNAPDGGAAVPPEVVNFHEVVSKLLGKDFKDDDTAQKAIKDTFSYVGEFGKARPLLKQLEDKFGPDYINKMADAVNAPQEQKPVDTSNFVSKDELAVRDFLSENPALKPHKTVLEALSKQTGKPLNEVAQLPEFKTLFDKASKFDEGEQSKSVLHTNSRLGAAQDKLTEAKTLQAAGNQTGAVEAAVSSVIEAFQLDK